MQSKTKSMKDDTGKPASPENKSPETKSQENNTLESSSLKDSSPESNSLANNLFRDLTASLVVFLVALPLCLGIALASGAPLFSGIVAGIVGGIVVGALSGSHTSVSGPAAGLTAVVATQIANLGAFDALLLAVVVGGVIQIGLGIAKAGALSAFFPSSVIKGLLAAIGVILILKQLPHLLGHDTDPEGEMSFSQPDHENTFSEIATIFQGEVHFGAAAVGFCSLALLVLWSRLKVLRNSGIPAPLIVVLVGVALQSMLSRLGNGWSIDTSHLVQIPIAESFTEFASFLTFPDFSQWTNPAVYVAGVTIAMVASLETLLNLEASDKLDPQRRHSPGSRELWAQGAGNVVAGLIGGIPVTSVVVRSSVNINAGATSKLSAILHGVLLLVCVGLFPVYLNMVPLAALAAILIYTGSKLASPGLFRDMWKQGRYQFAPFIITVVAIVFSDLLIGILIGLTVSVLFILNSNLRRPIRRVVEPHIDGDVVHVELANQVSFLNRAALDTMFNQAKPGSKLLLDASESDYIDPDVLSLIREFKEETGPTRGVSVRLRGFRNKYALPDETQLADFSNRGVQDRLTPTQVLEILTEGNKRFHGDRRISRGFGRPIDTSAGGQGPLAAVLNCIDSRVPAELVFDLGVCDIFSVRVAGNVIGTNSLGSLEYAVTVSGAKLVLVMGHTRCGAVASSMKFLDERNDSERVNGRTHLQAIVSEIHESVEGDEGQGVATMHREAMDESVDRVAKKNVERTVREIVSRSHAIRSAVDAGELLVVGAMYDVETGIVSFLTDDSVSTSH
ncbi:carbonic anhydrase/sulfate permease, SulP family [Neorhodopirellula lusitana]|uniref:Carbonic anhydrase/sulfate permease, SulP family n=2 Tax=Neorhodopirellula lusitana TaxID=445327 RepID=A0ABY1QPZ8_9BACT|nr:carbonic anhydrase/sulfate permease, SulP family [Neorhodopirellula lusitana]